MEPRNGVRIVSSTWVGAVSDGQDRSGDGNEGGDLAVRSRRNRSDLPKAVPSRPTG
jgi:hypothetical protein